MMPDSRVAQQSISINVNYSWSCTGCKLIGMLLKKIVMINFLCCFPLFICLRSMLLYRTYYVAMLFFFFFWYLCHSWWNRDHLNGRLELRVAVRQYKSKSVCAGLACCGRGWTAAFSVTTAPLKAVYANANPYKWTLSLTVIMYQYWPGVEIYFLSIRFCTARILVCSIIICYNNYYRCE